MNFNPRFPGQFSPNGAGFNAGEEEQPGFPPFEVVQHPSAPPQLPFAIKDNINGGYLTGGHPLFPRVFATPTEANDHVQSLLHGSKYDPVTDRSSASFQLASNTHPATAKPANTKPQKGTQTAAADQPYQYQIDDLSSSHQFGGYYRKIILEKAHRYGVDPRAIQALIYQESKGNPNELGHNHNGTTDNGIMQINSATIDPSTYHWRDPAMSIDAGARYLSHALARHGGDYERAFQSYNPGMRGYGSSVYSLYQSLGGGSAPKSNKKSSGKNGHS